MLKRILIVFVIFLSFSAAKSQTIQGKWMGHFNNKGDVTLNGSNGMEYILELNVEDGKVSGYSYSYFNNKKNYTVCSLDGTYNASTKRLEVTEVKRVRGNLPFTTATVLQTHYLTYTNNGDKEILSGIWKASNKRKSDEGKTVLSRYVTKSTPTVLNKPAVSVKEKLKEDKPKTALQDTVAKIQPIKTDPKIENKPDPLIASRETVMESQIEIKKDSFIVEIYDNGEIDGDTVTLFYNGKAIVQHQMLRATPITLKLSAEVGTSNQLIMYADNLGKVPPNTGLMIVKDGNLRYEVRLSTDMKKSSMIQFTHKSQGLVSK
jgi:hypothetical protein